MSAPRAVRGHDGAAAGAVARRPVRGAALTAGLAALALAAAGCAAPADAPETGGSPATATSHAPAPGRAATTDPTTDPSEAPVTARPRLDDPAAKDVAMQLVSSAENSSLDWRAQVGYIEDIGDGRGYTAGIIGFCSGTGDMLAVVTAYIQAHPDNPLAPYLDALRAVDGTDSHAGLGPAFEDAWREAAQDPAFAQAQGDERDRTYFDPAVAQGVADGLGALGQLAYYDAFVMHGPGDGDLGFETIRAEARSHAATPAEGGDEVAYLSAFLDARVVAMRAEEAHEDTSRVDTAQRVFLEDGNLDLATPLVWSVYGEQFRID